MLREDSSEVSKVAADRLGPGTELKLLDNSQKFITKQSSKIYFCSNFDQGLIFTSEKLSLIGFILSSKKCLNKFGDSSLPSNHLIFGCFRNSY